MIVLVTGGRTYGEVLEPRGSSTEVMEAARWKARQQVDFLRNTLTRLHKQRGPFTLIIQGGAKGADRQAEIWAYANNVKSKTVKADWKKYGQGAGAIRNQKMLDDNAVDLVIAFPGNKGTADMVRRADKANIATISFKEPTS